MKFADNPGIGESRRWPAPAKINLFLHVLGRRTDGRHELQTLFQILDYGDELEFQLRADGQVLLDQPIPGVDPEDDLCVRAARLLKTYARPDQGVSIRCHKRIPMGGGLGGGSSDAATCLVALNALWELGRSEDELAELGLRLGADVPVFVRGRTAIGEGVGEILRPINLPEPWYCVVTPDCSVPTGEIFQAPELTRDSSRLKISDLLAHRVELRNDCWPVVASRYPAVRRVHEMLSEHGDARMSGTGASVFLPCADRNQARRIASNLPDGWQAFIAQGLNQSPLLRRLEEQTTGV